MLNFLKRLSPFAYLNATQFLGALNDNVFKMLIVFLLLNIKGESQESAILAWVGLVFVLPFLLFSQHAGILADRWSKKKIIVFAKWLELFIAVGGLFIFYYQLWWVSFFMLFMMAAQSALFGPSKYGIIPEIVPKEGIAKANGYLGAFTYMAIIVGTFLASFLTEISSGMLTVAATCCVVVAALGVYASHQIPPTKPAGSDRKLSPFFPKDIWKMIKFCYNAPPLLAAVLSSSFFFFIGGFTQLNIIPFTTQRLGLDKTKAGYLFLVCALGIACGSYVAGKIVKRSHIAFVFLAGVGMSISAVLLSIFAHTVPSIVCFLILMGFFGGMFVIPADTFIQHKSPDQKRGQIIALNNFLSFIGVLLAAVLLYFLALFGSNSASVGFFSLGLLTLGISLVLLRIDIEEILYFFSKFGRHKNEPMLCDSNPEMLEKPSVYVFPKGSKATIWRIIRAIPNVHPVLLLPNKGKLRFVLKLMGMAVDEKPGVALQTHLIALLEKQKPLVFFEDQWSEDTLHNVLASLHVPKECIYKVDVSSEGTFQKGPYTI